MAIIIYEQSDKMEAQVNVNDFEAIRYAKLIRNGAFANGSKATIKGIIFSNKGYDKLFKFELKYELGIK